MPCKVIINVTGNYTAVTVKDTHKDSPCVDTFTKQKIEKVPVNSSATFNISVEFPNSKGGVLIEAIDTNSQASSDRYQIPAHLDANGKIRFPKKEAASQSDLDELAKEVQELKRNIAGSAPPRQRKRTPRSSGTTA